MSTASDTPLGELDEIIQAPCAGKKETDCIQPSCYWDEKHKICKRDARRINLTKVVEKWQTLAKMNAQNDVNDDDNSFKPSVHDFVTYTEDEKKTTQIRKDQEWRQIGDNKWIIIGYAGGNKKRKSSKRKVRTRKYKLHKRTRTKLKTRTKSHVRK